MLGTRLYCFVVLDCFPCFNDGLCIKISGFCDVITDCPDFSDEKNCGTFETLIFLYRVGKNYVNQLKEQYGFMIIYGCIYTSLQPWNVFLITTTPDFEMKQFLLIPAQMENVVSTKNEIL